ncbi:peptide chain release factor N(5)-glutamine methyltransferase [Arthrobacter sp. EH-1B-1]|uniref:Release factor glutamine methyltransferase n=1 Tax=Arthrobacter vasquezii TaxID=2977629 RepID=A0ABT6CZV9_9MICC|nr:peptide chain release factor N(5)-glutamine methyltransferase [Arthrobacter vasquezii]MDF9279395.1 peptide chain release factor N(5)-glutamine methyltransferase [Arthrobacter vasquezii]
MESLADALREAASTLAEAGVPSPRVDAELLAAHLMAESVGRVRALALIGAAVPEGYGELVAERAQRVPLQHITGIAYFRGLEVAVGPGVFIPRPETEAVAQLAIDAARGISGARVADLGTGSGAIAGSIAQEVPDADVYAVELSDLALAWAERNLKPHGVTLVNGDYAAALSELNGTFDVVVSNPPYIPTDAVPRDPEVAEHDPEIALYGGSADGLRLPLAAAAAAVRLLKPGGYFVMEHAEVQAEALMRILGADPSWKTVCTHQDLTERDRATSAIRTDVL